MTIRPVVTVNAHFNIAVRNEYLRETDLPTYSHICGLARVLVLPILTIHYRIVNNIFQN